MSIFGGLAQPNPADTTTDPKRLFRVLPKPPGSPFQFPYDIQAEVWDKWYQRRDERDLIVKMNTGSGKTVIGLVLLKSSLNEDKGPAVYLVPDKQLKSQVEATARALGLEVTDDVHDPRFRQGKIILVATVQKVYNGMSQFGLRSAPNRHVEVGTVVVDDAHACIRLIEAQFSLRVPRDTAAYISLRNLFSDSLKAQSLPGHAGLVSGEGSQAVPLSYWDWQQNVDTAFALLNSHAQADWAKFVWPLIKDQLAMCDVAFGPAEIEIRLPYPDLAVVPSYVEAARRIYMTATLADDSVLTTQMAVVPTCVTAPVVPASASDLGDRLILTPVETSRSVTHAEVRAKALEWSATQNVVVIVPSKYRASQWSDVTAEVHDRESIESVVDRLKAGRVGLVVLVARYDGIDLPDDACRILILDGLPERYSPQEMVEATAIGGTDEMESRQVQRIEQGMGRGVRSTDDYCAVILLDPRLVEKLYTAASRSQLSPATRAQYLLSEQFAASGHGQPIEFFDEAVSAFLDRDPAWVQTSKSALEDVVYEPLHEVPVVAVAERTAFDLALAGRFEEAKEALNGAFSTVSDARLRGWLKQRAASYLHVVDPVSARALQQSARIDNSYILKIPNDVRSARITAIGSQAEASSAALVNEYTTARNLQVGIDALLSDLVPVAQPGTFEKFEAAFERLGLILGFGSSRPDKETGRGPDNLWAIGSDRYWVVEAKSEAIVDEVSRGYLEQLSHSMDWFESEYPEPSRTALPVIVHPSNRPMWDAVPRAGARAMTFAKLEQLREAVRGFAAAVAIGEGYRTVEIVRQNLVHFGLNMGQLAERWTVDFEAPRR